MIVVKKKMKKSLLIMILAAVLAVLIVGAIVANTVMTKRMADAAGNGQSGSSQNDLPTAKEEYGEYSLNGQPYVFKPVEQKQMEYIQIRSEGVDKDGEHYNY